LTSEERDARLDALKAALTSWPRVEFVRMERRWRGLKVMDEEGIVVVVGCSCDMCMMLKKRNATVEDRDPGTATKYSIPECRRKSTRAVCEMRCQRSNAARNLGKGAKVMTCLGLGTRTKSLAEFAWLICLTRKDGACSKG
jgi:hypothetical protein